MGKYQEQANVERTGLEIAVIGTACRFPGAKNTEEFWENLKNGIETISFFSGEELIAGGVEHEFSEDPGFVNARGVIADAGFFDASFFGYKPLEAELMDPQIRIFYECAWESLEIAGYNPESYDGLIGLYAGATNNRGWEMSALLSEKTNFLEAFARDHLIDRDFLSTRLAYKLNLTGPAVTVKTACSTGLVAVDLACRGLLTGQCDIALAGGTSLMSNTPPGYLYKEGMISSPDGHCRAFDARAHGVIFSEGAGIVVLKRLADALADRDTIDALIRSSVVNNDGARKGTYEAPCIDGQAEVIQAAIHMAEVEPETIAYVETHGTGTVIGDPIEIEGLKRAFKTDKKGFCAIGSVKTNLGHLDTAAGIAGFIKTVLVLKHRLIPPSLHFEKANPKIDFANSPFYVNTSLIEWKKKKYPLRAGVSSFGVGGTNAHAVLEEAPPTESTAASRNRQLLLVSAMTEPALQKAAENLVNHLKKNPGIPIPDAAYTLQTGRKPFKFRNMWVVDPAALDFEMPQAARAREKNRLVFMFSGQGAQYVDMGREIYETERVFRAAIDQCFKILKPLMEVDIKEILYPGNPGNQGREVIETKEEDQQSSSHNNISHMPRINQTHITQPVIFAFEYSLAKLLMHWGLQPHAMIGHSIGEYVAACLSGVFSLEDALKLVTQRGKLMQQMPPGAMLSVTLPEEEVLSILQQHRELSLAAVNSTSLCVVSGPRPAVDAIENQLQQNGIECRRLHTSHAFHSQMMDPILEQFRQTVAEISLEKPRLSFISNLTGRWITMEQAQSPAYWEEHIRGTVRFRDGLTPLLEDPHAIFIEMGPGRGLATFVQKHDGKQDQHIILNLVKHPKEDSQDNNYLLNKIGRLWLYGVDINWQRFYEDEQRRRVALPTYPFQRKHYHLEAIRHLPAGEVGTKAGDIPPTILKKKTNPGEWLYVPTWKRTPDPVPAPEPANPLDWLVFMDGAAGENDVIGSNLEERLKQQRPQDRFTRVEIGPAYAAMPPENGDLIFTINPRQENDYQALIAELKKQQRIPRRIIHLWNTTAGNTGEQEQEWRENHEMYEYRGFYSLIYLAKALGGEGIGETIRIMVVSNNMQEVSGEETLCPPKALVLGPVRIIPLETPNLLCTSIDVLLPPAGSRQEKVLLDRLVLELTAETPENSIAYRGHYRWVQGFEPLPPEFPAAAPVPGQEKIPLLKDGGIYLITGGLGGIGLELARYLATKVNARLILLSRSTLPEPQERQNWLENHDYNDKTSTRIRKIRELEALGTGTEIMVVSADVSDYQQMQTVIDQAEKKWGKINGVIHAAGLPGGGVVQLKTPEIAGSTLAPKVQGTLVLDKILNEHPLDFFVCFSSINSVVPMFGQVDYFSANAFLDAFSHYKNSQDRVITVSINWDTWQEVGMAVEAAQQWKGRGGVSKGAIEIQHPLFERCLYQDPEQAIFVTHFNLNRHWVLNEHKIAESGKGLLPGVTYMEMARQALETYTGIKIGNGNRMVEISDVFFLNPLIAAEGEERETQLILEKQTQNHDMIYNFLVRSRSGLSETGWEKHALGKIRWREKEQEISHDIDQIAGEWVETRLDFAQSNRGQGKHDDQGGLVLFGLRWRSIRNVQLGEKQGLAFLDLDDEFSRDMEFYKLHPALLDSSTGFLFNRVGQDAYIPFAYKRLTMKAPLRPKIYSYCRVLETGETRQQESLKFDITIMDERGTELVDIKEFTMLRVSQQVKEKVKRKETASVELEAKVRADHREENEMLKKGILPQEGMEVFKRILTGAAALPQPLSQVVVSTTDLSTRMRHSSLSPMVIQQKQASGPQTPDPENVPLTLTLNDRPEISSVYVSPKTETEKTIAEIWQRLLGIKQVGINDDFFELGGDSLNVMQLNNELKNVLHKDIPVAVMFKHQTINAFARYLQQESTDGNVVTPEEDITDDIAESKDRLKARMRKRQTLGNDNE